MDSNQLLAKTSDCKSCGFHMASQLHFCPNCGGKVIRKRLTVKSIFIEFFQNLFNVDSRFIVTLNHLLFLPEQVFKAFITGARRRYYHPVSLLAIAIVFNALVSNLIDINSLAIDPDLQKKSFEIGYESAGGTKEGLEEELKSEELQQKFEESKKESLRVQQQTNQFVKDNGTLLAYINIPFYALIAFLVFRKREYNFAEMITIVLYQNAFTTFLGFFLTLLIYFTGLGVGEYILFSTLIVFLYSNYSFQRLFNLNAKQLILANIRFLFISICLFILVIILVAIVMIAIKFLNW